MKKKLIIGGGSLAALAAVAFIMASSGVPAANLDTFERIRGSDGYYADSQLLVAPDAGGELVANLADGQYIKVKFDVEYRVGKDWLADPGQAQAAFAAKTANIRSGLILLLGNKTSEETKGASLLVLKEDILKMINNVVFPRQLARAEDIIFKDWIVQK